MLDKRYNILFVDDEQEEREMLIKAFSGQYDFTLAKNAEQLNYHLESNKNFDLILLDLELKQGSKDLEGLRLIPHIKKVQPSTPIIIVTNDNNASTVKTAFKAGAEDFLPKGEYNKKEWLDVFHKVIANREIRQENEVLKAEVKQLKSNPVREYPFIGESLKILDIKKRLETVAQTPKVSVLILGETGTGKEVAARYLHRYSPRKDKPFIAVNLSAIQETLLESTLFGSVKGAFTGAVRDMEGYFKQANGGILMLDEIGDISQDIQIKLLRFLEDKKIRPVGSDKDIGLDIQIVAATHRDLPEQIQKGKFRADLYQRLKAMTITLPPLRERRDDLPLLFQYYFGESFSLQGNISVEALQKLMNYAWPGNIRELRYTVDYMLLQKTIYKKNKIDIECLPEEISGYESKDLVVKQPDESIITPIQTSFHPDIPRLESLALLNLQYIEEAMLLKNKVKRDVAEILGFPSADSLLYEIRTCFRKYPHLFTGDAFPLIKDGYPQIFR